LSGLWKAAPRAELAHGAQTHGAAAICNRDDWLLQAGFVSPAPKRKAASRCSCSG